MFRNVQMKIIREINHALDNPSVGQKKLAGMYQIGKGPLYFNPFDFLGLGKRSPHRRWNHDFFMAMMIGFKIGGWMGMQIALAHIYQDWMSDGMKKRMGTRNRDAWESIFNYYHVNYIRA